MTEEKTVAVPVAPQGAAIYVGSFAHALTDADRLRALGNIRRDLDEAKATETHSRNFAVDEKTREPKILLRCDEVAALVDLLSEGKVRARLVEAVEVAKDRNEPLASILLADASKLAAEGERHFDAALSTAKISIAQKRNAHNASAYAPYHEAARAAQTAARKS